MWGVSEMKRYIVQKRSGGYWKTTNIFKSRKEAERYTLKKFEGGMRRGKSIKSIQPHRISKIKMVIK